MNFIQRSISVIWLSLYLIPSSVAEDSLMIDNFESQAELRWDYISDQVMGGVSDGSLVFDSENGNAFAHLAGKVSIDNNGGFIQLRRELDGASVALAAGAYLKVRGNGQRYYLHLRTSRTLLPWQYYQASFQTTEQWQIIKVPLTAFSPSSSWSSKTVKPDSLRSIGIVAYGRDHIADIEIAEIGFY
ncbi:hypothetical protein GP2143_02689 [marine gamma proteobacterium HTCC2143]|jgi:hypothetical protein|uniref:NADH:ubiquinone oxidoreductase intermediate-associated protein 30 domain-containing protein n=1 Tax=marine gamma proteobacterium HTCC2143 TaxID=247633 RepID=A0YEF9_9GAMM|nr:hypothetical protein GP2143_02689 [marine gamma proteobacterium HTCC2143]